MQTQIQPSTRLFSRTITRSQMQTPARGLRGPNRTGPERAPSGPIGRKPPRDPDLEKPRTLWREMPSTTLKTRALPRMPYAVWWRPCPNLVSFHVPDPLGRVWHVISTGEGHGFRISKRTKIVLIYFRKKSHFSLMYKTCLRCSHWYNQSCSNKHIISFTKTITNNNDGNKRHLYAGYQMLTL